MTEPIFEIGFYESTVAAVEERGRDGVRSMLRALRQRLFSRR